MRYLITGGTGSFGSRYVRHLYDTTDHEITVFSRNEYEQWFMRGLFDDRVKFIIGDVRDYDAVKEAVQGQDIVIHSAALKHVKTGEDQPWETILTNINGTRNVSNACKFYGSKMVLLSTDKAVQPVNLYGASKMCAERIALKAGHAVTRWGNVFGSRGSILHIFKAQAAKGHLFTITDRRMTRFIITFEECFELVDSIVTQYERFGMPQKDVGSLNKRYYPESKSINKVFFPKNLYGINIPDLAYAFDKDAKFTEIGIQPGEKLNELLSDSPLISSQDCDKLTIEGIRRLIDES